jgi:hypothetical protein
MTTRTTTGIDTATIPTEIGIATVTIPGSVLNVATVSANVTTATTTTTTSAATAGTGTAAVSTAATPIATGSITHSATTIFGFKFEVGGLQILRQRKHLFSWRWPRRLEVFALTTVVVELHRGVGFACGVRVMDFVTKTRFMQA